jgi:hypothetical protein
VRRLLVNSAIVAVMLAVYFALRGQGVPFLWRLVAMGAVSAVLLSVAARGQRDG